MNVKKSIEDLQLNLNPIKKINKRTFYSRYFKNGDYTFKREKVRVGAFYNDPIENQSSSANC